jgi:flagellar hook assembly protein FlgD
VSSHVTLKVYDELGKEVVTLVDGNKAAGKYNVTFNGSDLASGIYYYRINAAPNGGQAGNFNEVKKLILLK